MSQTRRIFSKLFYSIGNLRLAIFLLLLISVFSSIGTIIEQEKSIDFYESNYPIARPIFGFISSKFIILFGLNHCSLHLSDPIKSANSGMGAM